MPSKYEQEIDRAWDAAVRNGNTTKTRAEYGKQFEPSGRSDAQMDAFLERQSRIAAVNTASDKADMTFRPAKSNGTWLNDDQLAKAKADRLAIDNAAKPVKLAKKPSEMSVTELKAYFAASKAKIATTYGGKKLKINGDIKAGSEVTFEDDSAVPNGNHHLVDPVVGSIWVKDGKISSVNIPKKTPLDSTKGSGAVKLSLLEQALKDKNWKS
jgi:hypothetical protein